MFFLPSPAADPVTPTRFAIVLGGGRSSRMGRDKMQIRVAGEPLLARAVDAALGWASQVVVVAPKAVWNRSEDDRISFTLEDPRFGGPAAGIKAGLQLLSTLIGDNGLKIDDCEVLLLAGDLADPHLVVATLAPTLEKADGTVLEDEEGWPQFLAGRYTLTSLQSAFEAAGSVRDRSVRSVLMNLDVSRVRVPLQVTKDLDTPDDLAMYS